MNLRCMYIPYSVYPFLCQWTPGLVPAFSYYEWSCYAHGVQIHCQDSAFNSSGYILRNGIVRSYIILFLLFWGKEILFPTVAASFSFPPTVHKGSNFSTLYWSFSVLANFKMFSLSLKFHSFTRINPTVVFFLSYLSSAFFPYSCLQYILLESE